MTIDTTIRIDGVVLTPLEMHRDRRGHFTEVYRDEWDAIRPVQWNVVRSESNVLRGVHVHRLHADYLIIADGYATIGLCDLRRGSPTENASETLKLKADLLAAIYIPPGIAHGFYFHVPSIHLYAVSRYWDPDDELGCHWADGNLGIDWPSDNPILSERDAGLGTLDSLRNEIPAYAGSR